MEEKEIIKYGVIIVIIIAVISIVFQMAGSSSHNNSIAQKTVKINATTIKETFNLTANSSKILTGNLTYKMAVNSTYIPMHYAISYTNYYSALPIVFSTVNPLTHQSYINITSNKRIMINESGAEVIINLNGNYAFIKVNGGSNKIYIINGLYGLEMPTTSPTVKESTIITRDSYPVD
jgi:hypothetical protein